MELSRGKQKPAQHLSTVLDRRMQNQGSIDPDFLVWGKAMIFDPTYHSQVDGWFTFHGNTQHNCYRILCTKMHQTARDLSTSTRLTGVTLSRLQNTENILNPESFHLISHTTLELT